jgi:hypothetical protein
MCAKSSFGAYLLSSSLGSELLVENIIWKGFDAHINVFWWSHVCPWMVVFVCAGEDDHFVKAIAELAYDVAHGK